MSEKAPSSSAIILFNELVSSIEQREPLQKVVRKYACYVLACHGGNKSKAADALEVDRRTLHRWEIERRAMV